MATSYFGNRSSTTGISPFKKLKPILLPNRTNVPKLSTLNASGYAEYNHIPIWRSAVANNYFVLGSGNLSLYSVNSSGTATLVNTSTFTSHLASSQAVALHLNTTDQCIYVLLYASPQYRLIKVSDSLGTTTTIGSAFTPTTATRWPTQLLFDQATMADDGTGSIKIYCRGYTHQLNKTTGAVVTQDVAVNINSMSLVNTAYLSSDGTLASATWLDGGTEGGSILKIPQLTAASGQILDLRVHTLEVSDRILHGSLRGLLLVDSDKVFLGTLDATGGTNQNCFGYVYRSDFDQFLQSVIDWNIGA